MNIVSYINNILRLSVSKGPAHTLALLSLSTASECRLQQVLRMRILHTLEAFFGPAAAITS
jgi:hypothetical protein